jgi:hypothetical protein
VLEPLGAETDNFSPVFPVGIAALVGINTPILAVIATNQGERLNVGVVRVFVNNRNGPNPVIDIDIRCGLLLAPGIKAEAGAEPDDKP